nr:MAG TPA: hypothetical protein [Caudoviricetes sp.]
MSAVVFYSAQSTLQKNIAQIAKGKFRWSKREQDEKY